MWAVVVAQLPTPEIHGSNPIIDKFYLLSTEWSLYILKRRQ